MEKMFLVAVMAAMAASVSFGACDEACWYECIHIKDKQQRAECFVGCGYNEIGSVCIKENEQTGIEFKQKHEIGKDNSGTKIFTHDNPPAAR